MDQRIDLLHPVTVCKASAGTGKTFTLAAYYIGLLMSGEDFRSILAITFTNKATAEMSTRILTNLYEIANSTVDEQFMDAVESFMYRNREKDAQWIADRARDCFNAMLADFDNVQIRTIDSFLQTLLTGLAGMLHQSAGMTTELDIKHVISEAADQLLTTDLTEENRKIIEKYTNYKISQATSWDIRKNLRELAQLLYNEQAQMLDSDDQIDFDAKSIARRREEIEQLWLNHPDVKRMYELMDIISQYDLSVTNGKSIVNAMNNIRKSIEHPKEIKQTKERFRGLTDDQIIAINNGSWKKVPQAVLDMILEATQLVRQSKGLYYTVQLTIELSHEMELMSSLQHIIRRNLAEANSELLSRTAGILSDALKEGDADFILEKAGIRYHHVLMDEFQDTSKLQWAVIKKLLEDLLAGEEHTLLIVGDIKQAIYRWRNGDWEIMEGLTRDGGNDLTRGRINERFTSLTKNFRSSEEVVKFNLSLFKYLLDNYPTEVQNDPEEARLAKDIYNENFSLDQLAHYYQGNKKPGGYVQFSSFPRTVVAEGKEKMVMDMFQTMETLLDQGMQPTDMMVLARFGADAKFITDMFSHLDTNQFPRLTKIHMVSENSFLLDASEEVKCVIAGLQVIHNNDELAARYIEMVTQKPDIIGQIRQQVNRRTPLYEAVCELIKLLFTDENGQYQGSQTAYINNFLDRTRAYVQAYGSHAEDFLDYWQDALHEKTIPVGSTDAIRIMTVHKSKGLQSQTLFVPFCTWEQDETKDSTPLWCQIAAELQVGDDFVPIRAANEMAISAYSDRYEAEHRSARIDSLNMLYVALTRAEDNLYIYSDYQVEDDGTPKQCTHVGQYIMDFLAQSNDYICDEGTYRTNTQPVIKQPKGAVSTSKADKPFSFEGTPSETAELWANSDQVRFIQSQEGAMYTECGDAAYRMMARMDEGTLCHEIFANIHSADELDRVLDEFETRGEIRDKEQREELKALISSAWEGNEQMRSWFVDPWELKLEEAIYIAEHEIRPDRVMIDRNTNDAIVLDYKFGHWENSYITQVQHYMAALRDLGHPHVEGYLWFARENRLVPVPEAKEERVKG